MNFEKLQEMQKALDDSIIKEKQLDLTEEERFELTCHAFLAELSEVANSNEYFKFWKTNTGKVDNDRFTEVLETYPRQYIDKRKQKWITKAEAQHRTLVEEVSDCLHFLLSLANQTGTELGGKIGPLIERNTTGYYFETTGMVLDLLNGLNEYGGLRGLSWDVMLLEAYFRAYYTKLGITTEELEQAYYDKNKVNYERLRSDY